MGVSGLTGETMTGVPGPEDAPNLNKPGLGEDGEKLGGLKFLAVVGWFVVGGVASILALVFHWDALTEPPRPLILRLVGIPYWLLVLLVWLALTNFDPQKGSGSDR